MAARLAPDLADRACGQRPASSGRLTYTRRMRRTPASRSRDAVRLAVAAEAREAAREGFTLDPILGDDSAQRAADAFVEQAAMSLVVLATVAEERA